LSSSRSCAGLEENSGNGLQFFIFFNQLQPVEVELIQMGNAKQHWNVPNLGSA